MKKRIAILTSILILIALPIFAQTIFKEIKAGHTFNISLPDYMSKSIGMNAASILEYKNVVKGVFGIVICDSKEELELAEMKFTTINEFFDFNFKDYLKDEENRKISEPITQKKGDISYSECDLYYFDKDPGADIYCLLGVVETKTAFYQVISYVNAADKDKYKPDFQKILYSIND